MLPIALLFFVLMVSGANAAENGAEIYRQAEEGEWLGKANMKEVDELYRQAAEAGNPQAFLAQMRNRIAFADPEQQNRLAEKLCPEARKIMADWQDSKDADALFYMARYYGDGICENRDGKKARLLLKRAADAGSLKGQYFLGKFLLKKDEEQAFKLLARAADSGFPLAMALQGSCYLLGRGVKKDAQKGMELIDKALATGNSNAMYDVAIWYLEGSGGLAKNAGKAREILEELESRDYEPARAPLEELSNSGKNN